MGFKGTKAEKKVHYDKKMCELLEQYERVLICAADNVGSTQMQGIRKGLRPESVVLMGKNTMMKRTIRIYCEKSGNTQWLNILPLLVVSALSLYVNSCSAIIMWPFAASFMKEEILCSFAEVIHSIMILHENYPVLASIFKRTFFLCIFFH
mgnify:CR=1 FL=1